MSDYETDFVAWTENQAELLRRRAAGELVNDMDWANLAEEIEAVGRSERRELRHRMVRLLQHLLKWHFQPERRSRSWQSTIRTQRREIETLLEDSPTLRQTLPEVVAKAYAAARQEAEAETGLLHLPQDSPFTADQALTGELPL